MNWETNQVYHVVAGNFNESDYIYWRERASDLADQYGHGDAIQVLADELRDAMDEGVPDIGEPYQSLLTGAFSEVNWREVAEVALEDWEK